ncbi:MAG: nickel pincer cofactor-dependent isomerase, group 22 [Armatimonadota bacterium]
MLLGTLYHVEQRLGDDGLADVAGALTAQLHAARVPVSSGMRVAIAVGSRGIARLPEMVRAVASWVKDQGGQPFIVPAMGSHGGATVEGQQAVLTGYGITEDAVGAPVRATMEVVELPREDCPLPVCFDRHAAEADATILLNRVAPHTSFHGRYESGLMKMLAIGLGKHQQALAIHQHGGTGLRDYMPLVARQVLRHANVLLGVAVVESARGEIGRLEVLPAAEIPSREPALLEMARANTPALPIDAIDLLIVDEIGKNISGSGMNPSVIGRRYVPGMPKPERPRIRLILVRDLSDETHGNAVGIELADLMVRRAADKIDLDATNANLDTVAPLYQPKLPAVARDDRRAVEMAMYALRGAGDLRVVRIKNTRELQHFQASQAVVTDLTRREGITIHGPVDPLWLSEDELAPV